MENNTAIQDYIAAQCDRTIRLHDGVIIEDGRSGEVVEPTARGANTPD